MSAVNILQFSVKGIKNISKTITLDFYKKKVDNNFDMGDYNIKSIYGPNGVGKTAIIDAFALLDNFFFNKNYLVDDNTILLNLINQSLKRTEISILFYFSVGDFRRVMQYDITLAVKDDSVYIEKEQYLIGKNIPSKVVLSIQEGKVFKSDSHTEFDTKVIHELEEDFKNISRNSSIFSLVFSSSKYREKMKINEKENIFMEMQYLFYAFKQVIVKTDYADSHSFYKASCHYKESFEQFQKQGEQNEPTSDEGLPGIISKDNYNKIPHSETDDIVLQSELKEYREHIEVSTAILKILKPDILKIELDMRNIDDKRVLVRKNIVYKNNYKVNAEFESSGIKKILELADLLVWLDKGKILIVDELDAHLHDMFLTNLLEYYSNFLEGQLIFTTHNLSHMEVLKNQKKSIDFLTPKNEIVSWVQKGNKSPLKAYKNGHIQGLPFNYDFTDFLLIFNQGGED